MARSSKLKDALIISVFAGFIILIADTVDDIATLFFDSHGLYVQNTIYDRSQRIMISMFIKMILIFSLLAFVIRKNGMLK